MNIRGTIDQVYKKAICDFYNSDEPFAALKFGPRGMKNLSSKNWIYHFKNGKYSFSRKREDNVNLLDIKGKLWLMATSRFFDTEEEAIRGMEDKERFPDYLGEKYE